MKIVASPNRNRRGASLGVTHKAKAMPAPMSMNTMAVAITMLAGSTRMLSPAPLVVRMSQTWLSKCR